MTASKGTLLAVIAAVAMFASINWLAVIAITIALIAYWLDDDDDLP